MVRDALSGDPAPLKLRQILLADIRHGERLARLEHEARVRDRRKDTRPERDARAL